MFFAAEPIVTASSLAEPAAEIAWAPNVPAGTWPASTLPVTFYLGLPRSRDVGDAAGAELDVALRTWAGPSCSAFRASYGGERAAASADDGVNMVLFHDDAWPAELQPGVVAQTVVTLDSTGNLHDADIHLNGKDFRFSLRGDPGTLDLRSILVHELGHALGLGHSTEARATMFATGSGLRWRSLEQDDVMGVCALYPGAGAPGCGALPCPSGMVCVARACQRLGDRTDVCSPCERVPGACEAAGDDARCVDLPGGRVCGRGCAKDEDCGAGFRCARTSASGDLQCVSDDGCKTAASPCVADADCKDSLCRDGACMGPGEDGGVDAGTNDAGTNDAGEPQGDEAGGGGCDCRAALHHEAPLGSFVLAAVAFGAISARWRRRREP